MCKKSKAVTPDQCDETIIMYSSDRYNYCKFNPNADPIVCKDYEDKHKKNYDCLDKSNVTAADCKDYMDSYCRNPNGTYNDCKDKYLDSYCLKSRFAKKDECKGYMHLYCQNPNKPDYFDCY